MFLTPNSVHDGNDVVRRKWCVVTEIVRRDGNNSSRRDLCVVTRMMRRDSVVTFSRRREVLNKVLRCVLRNDLRHEGHLA